MAPPMHLMGQYLQLFTATTRGTVSKNAAAHHDTPLDLSNKDFRLYATNFKARRLFAGARKGREKFDKSCPLVFQDATLFSGEEAHKLRKEAKLQ